MIAEPKHCDDYIDDPSQPECLRRYLGWARLPASCKYPPKDPAYERYISEELRPHIWRGPPPTLFADHEGKRVRIVMASRFGGVGITTDLKADHGYSERVAVEALSNFSDAP